MDKPLLVYSVYIAATPERVWAGLTDGEFTREYWGGLRIQSDWHVGAVVSHVNEDGAVGLQGEVLQADPPRLLSYTFHMQISPGHRADKPSRVTFEIVPFGAVTKLTLTHDQFEPGSITFETTFHGWPAIMSSLKSLLETGKALPFKRLGFGPKDTQTD